MELRDLQLFQKIVEEGSFTKAAEALYLSQPTLSKNLKSLEKELEIQLFERSTKSLHITDAGKIVYAQSKEIFQILNQMHDLLNDLKNIEIGEVHIGIPPLIGTLFFPKLIATFNKLYPNIQIHLTELGAKKIGQLVENSHVSIGFVVLPMDESKFNIHPLFTDEFTLFVNKEHHLADRKHIAIKDLSQEAFIIFNNEFTLHDLVINTCKQYGFNPKIAYESSQWDLIMELVASNLGVTLLPRCIFNNNLNENIVMIELTDSLLWNIGVVTKKDKYISFAEQRFIEVCQTINM